MTTPAPDRIARLLRVLAFVQGFAIVVFAALLLHGDEPAPESAPSAPAPPPAAAASPATPAPAPVATRGEDATLPRATASTGDAATTSDAAATVLYGRVVDEAGETITESSVWLSRADDHKQLGSARVTARDPCFAIAGLAPGEVAFQTRATGYIDASGSFTIAPGTARLRQDFVLTKAWLITVKILTPDGKPLQAALAEVAKERPNLFLVQVGAVASPARPEGDFPLTSLREITAGIGRWRAASGFDARMRGDKQQPKDVAGVLELDGKQPVWISAVLRQRVLASARVELGQDEITLTVGVDQVLRDLCTIRGRIVDAATKEPVADARVSFGDRQSGGAGAKVDAQGRFESRNLRPGLLTIEVYAGQRQAQHDLVLVQPGQELDLGDVPVFAYRTITGHCEGLLGKAESGRVSYVLLDPPSHASLRREPGDASLEADGSFKLYVIDGRYRLRASGAGGVLVEIDTRTLGEQPLVLQLAKEAPLRVDVAPDSAGCELAVFDDAGRELYRRDLQRGWKFSLPFLLGDYRVELKGDRGKVDTRRIALGDAGADLRVP